MRMSLKVKALICALLLSGGVAIASETGESSESDALQDQIVSKYLTATQEQQAAMRGVSMHVDIDAEVPKLQSKGKLQALRYISKLGKITYNALGFSGDKRVRNEVIARYLSAETQSQTGPDLSITPTNYKFKYKGLQNHDGEDVYVLQVSPRHKKVGLFKGELWVDPQTCMPLRESGRLVKSPSIFLKKIEFVRTYLIKDGLAVPQHIESKVQTRIFGPVNVSVDFSDFVKEPAQDVAANSNTVQ